MFNNVFKKRGDNVKPDCGCSPGDPCEEHVEGKAPEQIAQEIVRLPWFRLAFPQLGKPYTVNNFLPPKYAGVACFELGDDLGGLEEAMHDVAEQQFGPHYSGHTGAKLGKRHLEMYKTVFMSSKQKPDLRRQGKDERVFRASADDFYPGCFCTAEVLPFAYNANGFKGVALCLLQLTKVQDATLTAEEAEALADPDAFLK